MASTVLFVIMAVIACILLIVSSLAATYGASEAFGSSLYNKYSQVRSAHQYLTIAAVLGWSSFAVLVVVLIVGAIASGFTLTEIGDRLLTNQSPTKADLLAVYKAEKELSAGSTTQIIILVILIIISLITLVVGILSIVAAIDLGGLPEQDSKSQTAYTASVVAAVAGFGGIAIMIVATIAYIAIKNARENTLKRLEEYEMKAEKLLGVTPAQVETAAKNQ